MWTLQRMLAEESKTKHAMMSSKFSDSGRGSGSSRSSGPFKMFDRFPSLRSAARHKPYSLKMNPVNLGISGNNSLSNQNHLNFQGCRDHLGSRVQRAVSHELHVYRHAFRKSERLKCVLLKITAIL